MKMMEQEDVMAKKLVMVSVVLVAKRMMP